MARVLLLKIEVAGLALDHLLLWNSSNFPIIPLLSLPLCLVETVKGAIFLVGVDLGVLVPTVQTWDDHGRFARV